MRLRRLSADDLDIVRRLRNANREWFFDTREISAAQQRAWFDGLATRPVDFYVIDVDDRVVGTISLTVRADGIEVGNLLLDDAARGRGVMRQAVAMLTAPPGQYFAEVKDSNGPSLRVFRSASFSESVEGDVIRFTKRVSA